MSRFRKNRSTSGGGGGSNIPRRWVGPIALVFGVICLLISLVSFNLCVDSLDDAVTDAATYTEQVGVTDIMGVGMLMLWVVFIGIGLVAVGAGGYSSFVTAKQGSWMDIILATVMGAISIVMVIFLFNVAQEFLHTAWTTVNATTNKTYFESTLNIIGIFGLVTWATMIFGAVGGVLGAVWGLVTRVKSSQLT